MSNKERDPQTYAIIGAAMEVHRELGPGFFEPPYQESMEIELGLRGIAFQAQPKLTLYYKGREPKSYYKPDLICYEEVVVELKAQKCLTEKDESQIINSLKCARKRIGLLINFGEPSLVYRRFINDP